MLKKIMTIGLAVLLTAGAIYMPVQTSATGSSDLNKSLNEIKKENAELKKKINETNKEKSKYQKELNALDDNINAADRELKGVESEISSIEDKIVERKEALTQAAEELKETEEIFKRRVRAMYKNGTMGYLDILFSSKDSASFLGNVDAVQRITENDKDIIEEIEKNKKAIEDEKERLEAQEILLAGAKQDMEVKKNKLMVASRNKEQRLKEVMADKEEIQKMINANNRDAKAIEAEIVKRQLAMDYTGGAMMWPLPGHYRISSPYGNRIHPILRTKQFHSGIDIPAPGGTKILAANDGVVTFAGRKGSYGNLVGIDHGGKITTFYAHTSRILVKNGQKVKKGQAIALVGSTGRSTGNHLHFEVRKNGKTTNPQAQFKK